jgi:imidazolonepropionase
LPFVALAVRELGMTPGEAVHAATAGGAAALDETTSVPGARRRADLVLLDAPTMSTSHTAPGYLVSATWIVLTGLIRLEQRNCPRPPWPPPGRVPE